MNGRKYSNPNESSTEEEIDFKILLETAQRIGLLNFTYDEMRIHDS